MKTAQKRLGFKGILYSYLDMLYRYDRYTFNHSLRVARLSAQIADSLSCSRELLERISVAALMHDIGKIFIPKFILNKPSLLTNDERENIHSHTLLGYLLLGQFTLFDNVKDIVFHHHEQYDGQGYPYGLKKQRIPLESRVISVADTFDALTSTRVYHEAIVFDEALMEINRNANSMFDPMVVERFNLIVQDIPE